MTTLLDDAMAHHIWATERLIDTCAELSADQLNASAPGPPKPDLHGPHEPRRRAPAHRPMGTWRGDGAHTRRVPLKGAPTTVDDRIEAITLPVSDINRASDFYLQAGWNLDVDTEPAPGMRVVQLTPRGSGCSITFGIGFPQSEPGSYVNTYLVVSDIEAAHQDLRDRGIPISAVFHWSERGQTPGPDPKRGDYGSYFTFADPDGNQWLLQEVPSRAVANEQPASVGEREETRGVRDPLQVMQAAVFEA